MTSQHPKDAIARSSVTDTPHEHLYYPPSGNPMTGTPTVREQIARVIDPHAEGIAERWAHAAWGGNRLKNALAKADAILAAQPLLEGGEETERGRVRWIVEGANDYSFEVAADALCKNPTAADDWKCVERWLRAEVARLSTLPAALGGDGWKPIETAPKDGTRILAAFGDMVTAASWEEQKYNRRPAPYWSCQEERWRSVAWVRANQPTHWQPLPAAPSQGKTP